MKFVSSEVKFDLRLVSRVSDGSNSVPGRDDEGSKDVDGSISAGSRIFRGYKFDLSKVDAGSPEVSRHLRRHEFGPREVKFVSPDGARHSAGVKYLVEQCTRGVCGVASVSPRVTQGTSRANACVTGNKQRVRVHA